LVLAVIDREDGAEIAVVYGTSQRVDKLSAGEFAITRLGHAAAYKAAGLSHDTKFDFKQTAHLPWNDDFFAVPPGGTQRSETSDGQLACLRGQGCCCGARRRPAALMRH
jgi:hypothetical protein